MAGEWAVTEEALAAMDSTASGMEETRERLHRHIETLEGVFEDNEIGLGAHSADIRELLEELKAVGESADGPIKRLVLKLVRSVSIRRQHIEENSYQGKRR